MLTLYYIYILKRNERKNNKMEQINEEFNVPYYIFEEIIEYVELTAKGYSKCMKWENIRALLRLAVVNERLTEQQAEFLEKELKKLYNSFTEILLYNMEK